MGTDVVPACIVFITQQSWQLIAKVPVSSVLWDRDSAYKWLWGNRAGAGKQLLVGKGEEAGVWKDFCLPHRRSKVLEKLTVKSQILT